MPLPKFEEAKKLNDQEISEQILSVKKQLFDLRFQKATRQLEKTHQFKQTRHRLAQLMTVQRQRQLQAAAEAKASPSAAASSPVSEPVAGAEEE